MRKLSEGSGVAFAPSDDKRETITINVFSPRALSNELINDFFIGKKKMLIKLGHKAKRKFPKLCYEIVMLLLFFR